MSDMVKSRKTRLAALLTSGAMAVGLAAVPAASAGPTLVKVEVTRVLNNNVVSVAIPINAAANICGLDVDVLTGLLTPVTPGDTQTVTCTATANPNQSGLITVTRR